jgi:hypothetical protein
MGIFGIFKFVVVNFCRIRLDITVYKFNLQDSKYGVTFMVYCTEISVCLEVNFQNITVPIYLRVKSSCWFYELK